MGETGKQIKPLRGRAQQNGGWLNVRNMEALIRRRMLIIRNDFNQLNSSKNNQYFPGALPPNDSSFPLPMKSCSIQLRFFEKRFYYVFLSSEQFYFTNFNQEHLCRILVHSLILAHDKIMWFMGKKFSLRVVDTAGQVQFFNVNFLRTAAETDSCQRLSNDPCYWLECMVNPLPCSNEGLNA